jgi:hypothetical protein
MAERQHGELDLIQPCPVYRPERLSSNPTSARIGGPTQRCCQPSLGGRQLAPEPPCLVFGLQPRLALLVDLTNQLDHTQIQATRPCAPPHASTSSAGNAAFSG